VEVEESSLALGESANVQDSLRLDAHALERGPVREETMRSPESSKPMKPRSTKWSMLGRQQQFILPIQTLVVRRIPPGFAMARDEVNRVRPQ
jgi:hypothetical protein